MNWCNESETNIIFLCLPSRKAIGEITEQISWRGVGNESGIRHRGENELNKRTEEPPHHMVRTVGQEWEKYS
jgi:hypothetical protein